jgi:hypothetical protein
MQTASKLLSPNQSINQIILTKRIKYKRWRSYFFRVSNFVFIAYNLGLSLSPEIKPGNDPLDELLSHTFQAKRSIRKYYIVMNYIYATQQVLQRKTI